MTITITATIRINEMNMFINLCTVDDVFVNLSSQELLLVIQLMDLPLTTFAIPMMVKERIFKN